MLEERKIFIRDCYENKFNAFLAVCKNEKMWQMSPDAEPLKERIKTANRLSHELTGMAVLMQDIGVISPEEYYAELDRIAREFSTIELFGCFLAEEGTVYVFRRNQL